MPLSQARGASMREVAVWQLVVVVVLAVSVTHVAASRGVGPEDLPTYTFDRYVRDYGKHYLPAEYERRRGIFGEQLKRIIAFNAARPSPSYAMGVNALTDMTDEEFRQRQLGRARTGATPHTRSPRAQSFRATGSAVPTNMSWIDHDPPVLTPIKEQGKCGSCWAHSAVEAIESMDARKTGKLRQLSTQQLTSCVENTHHCGGTGGCSGATVQIAWDYVKSVGLTSSENYPYTSGAGDSGECVFNSTSMPVEVYVSGYTTVTSNSAQATMEALSTQGPLAVSVDASQWRSYSTGIFNGCSAETIEINHAVQLVGYGEDEELGGKYWIVRNSWGTSWGMEGYIYLARSDDDESSCAVVEDWLIGGGCENETYEPFAACGMCGILYDVTYPNVGREVKSFPWIAGVAFGVLALLMLALFLYTKCNRVAKSDAVFLLDETDSVNP